MEDAVIAKAEFDPNVKKYWLFFALIAGTLTVVGIVLLPIVVVLVWVLSQRILDAMSAELFRRKLVVKRGIFFRVEKSIPLDKITDVGLTQGPLMRALGLYRLDFETAGQSGPGGAALVSLLGVVGARDFREAILSQKDSLQTVPVDGPQGHEAVVDAGESDTMAQLLQSVRNIERMLSERE